jgi:hypothetical protein
MDLTLATCFVLIHDPDLALAFYRDTLGLEVRNDVANGDFRWITVGGSSQPGVNIVLTNYLMGSPADNDQLAALLAKGALNGVNFRPATLTPTSQRSARQAPRSSRSRPSSSGARRTSPSATLLATWSASSSGPRSSGAMSPGQCLPAWVPEAGGECVEQRSP